MITKIVSGADGARSATGVVVVIDVMGAFTTAAYAFGAGFGEIELVATVEEALASPGFRMGEVGGRLIPGFDHNNSPSRLVGSRLHGRAVMRTGSGTRCVAEAGNASEIWLGSLVVASATVRALSARSEVTFVASGAPHEGEEDVACAELMAASLHRVVHDRESVIAAVVASRAADSDAGGGQSRHSAVTRSGTASGALLQTPVGAGDQGGREGPPLRAVRLAATHARRSEAGPP